ILTMRSADWERDLGVILTGAFHCARAVLPTMLSQGGGSIVSVSSVNAHTHVGAAAYSAAKAGLESLTRNLAVELAHRGVRANAVVPGTFATDAWKDRQASFPDILTRLAHWYPLGRLGTAEDIASLVRFL